MKKKIEYFKIKIGIWLCKKGIVFIHKLNVNSDFEITSINKTMKVADLMTKTDDPKIKKEGVKLNTFCVERLIILINENLEIIKKYNQQNNESE